MEATPSRISAPAPSCRSPASSIALTPPSMPTKSPSSPTEWLLCRRPGHLRQSVVGPGVELRPLCPRPAAHNHRPHARPARDHRSQRIRKILDLLDAWAARAIPLQPERTASRPAHCRRRPGQRRGQCRSSHSEARRAAPLGLQWNSRPRQREHRATTHSRCR